MSTIPDTVNLLNSPETDYNWCEQFKIEHERGLGNQCILMGSMHFISVLSFAFLPFTPLVGSFCPLDGGAPISRITTTFLGGLGMLTSSIWLAKYTWDKCTISWTKFSVLTDRNSRIELLRSQKCLTNTGFYSFGVVFLANAILVTTINLVCK